MLWLEVGPARGGTHLRMVNSEILMQYHYIHNRDEWLRGRTRKNPQGRGKESVQLREIH
jgi:hypothetical protein